MRTLLLAATLVLAIPVAAPAHADTPARAEADQLFLDGRAAIERADFGEAYRKLLKSYQLDPAVGTLLNLALCEEHFGRVADALARFREAAAKLKPGDDRLPRTRQRMEELSRRVPRLRVSLAGAPPGTTALRDGKPVSGQELDAAIEVNPERHIVQFDEPGRAPRTYELTLAEGDSVERGWEPAQASAPPIATASAAAPPSSSRRTAGFVIGAAGLASLAAGIVTGVMLSSKRSTVEAHCDAKTRLCDSQSAVDAAESGKVLWPVSVAAWSVGWAALGLGAVLVLTGDSGRAPRTAVGVQVVGSGGVVGVNGSF